MKPWEIDEVLGAGWEERRIIRLVHTPKLLAEARRVGCPSGQIERFLRGGYVPQPKQLLFHAACRAADADNGPTDIGFGGARGPGKSHAMYAQIALDDCQRFAGLKCLMLRKVGKALKESAEDLRGKILCTTPHKYNKSTGTTTFPNGSKIILGHFRTESDIDAYVGLEYDLIAIEECTTLSGAKYSTIATCCRTSKTGWRPRRYSNANPGGVGHQFYLRKFVNSKGNGVVFIPATYKDNVFLNKDYVKSLENLTGWLRKAWLEGDWNIHAGTYFTTFSEGHVIEPYAIDQRHGWSYYLAADYGWAHPTAFILMAQDNKGDVIFVDDYSAAKRRPKVHHQEVLRMLARWGLGQHSIRTFVMGSDAWRPGEDGVAPIDAYEALGWRPEHADMRRIPGAMKFLDRLGDPEAGVKSTLWFFKTCRGLVEQLPTMQHDPHRPEDVLKVNVDQEGFGGDDYYDAARYGLMLLADKREVFFGTLSVPR